MQSWSNVHFLDSHPHPYSQSRVLLCYQNLLLTPFRFKDVWAGTPHNRTDELGISLEDGDALCMDAGKDRVCFQLGPCHADLVLEGLNLLSKNPTKAASVDSCKASNADRCQRKVCSRPISCAMSQATSFTTWRNGAAGKIRAVCFW